jgi:plasmid stability protein
MSNLVIPNVDESLVERLSQRAAAHGRTPAIEAKAILQEALEPSPAMAWEQVNAIRERLLASGAAFSDSAHLVREDRDR